MKNTLLAIILAMSLVGQMIPAAVFAQEVYDYNYGGTTYDYNYGGGQTYDYNYGGTTYDYNYGSNPGTTYDYNYGGNTYDYNYGSTGTTGTTYDYNYGGTTYDYNYGSNPGTTYDYNYGSNSGTTYDYNYGSAGTTYDYNYVTNGTTYDYNYTTPSWTGYTPTYTTPTYTNSYTYPTYTYPTYTYTQPTITNPVVTNPVVTTPVVTTPTTTTCPAGTVLVNGTCQTTTRTTTTTTCSTNTVLVNGTCQSTQTVPVVTTTVCSDGLAPVNGSCVRTNVVPTTSTTICSDGSYPVNGTCVRTNIIPATTVTYQTCWNGSTIPLGSVCPQQYKTCPNGTMILLTQMCPITYTPPTPPVVIKFNNVITSVATEITTTSARCNGIGLIASGAQSTGWFEYGETANLGRETGHANIGSAPTAPFSNVLVNLKPATTYYCRAVMNNQYGTVKGEIVLFTTKSTAVKYVKPIVKTTTTTTVKKTTVAKKNEVVCVDGTVATVGSQKAAGLLNAGEKLVSLQIEKVSGDIAPGSMVSYKLTVKNLSSESLPGTVVKVTIPAEVTLTQASAGTFDPSVRTLTIDNMPLSANGEGTVLWTGVVNKDTQSGKQLVTTAYSNYSVPGSDLHDEVTAYVVGSVVPNPNGTTTDNGTGAKKVIGTTTDRGFLPDTLVEWLALIAILFIIFILGRSVYMSMQGDKNDHH